MLNALLRTCVVAGYIAIASVPTAAQEVIHALTGTIASIDDTAKTITVFQDNGSKSVFKELTDSKTRIAFDKRIAQDTTAAKAFDKQGAFVILFYFGNSENRTAVAIKSLGAGPFASTKGTVSKFDGRAHAISVTDASGTVSTFKIEAQTVVEAGFGAIDGTRFQPQKGDAVRVVSVTADGNPTALFIGAM